MTLGLLQGRHKPHTPADKETGKQSHAVVWQSDEQSSKSPPAVPWVSEPKLAGSSTLSTAGSVMGADLYTQRRWTRPQGPIAI